MYWGTTIRMMAEFSPAMVEARRQRNFIVKVQKKEEVREKDRVITQISVSNEDTLHE